VPEASNPIKQGLNSLTPATSKVYEKSQATDLKGRLDWGEPGLTILDVRSRAEFDASHILGAMHAPVDRLEQGINLSLEPERDIYIYGATDEETATAAGYLRSAGFYKVSEVQGGLDAWNSIGGATEGIAVEEAGPHPDSFNIVTRLKKFAEERKNARAMKAMKKQQNVRVMQ
jgi:rhodanese-related sulfurtransferase